MEIVSARDTFLIMLGLFNCNLCFSAVEHGALPTPALHCTAQAHPNCMGELASSPALQPLDLRRRTLSCSGLHCCSWAGLQGGTRDAPAPALLQSWAAPSSALSLQEQQCVLRAHVSGVSLPRAAMTRVLNTLFLGELFMLNLFWAG